MAKGPFNTTFAQAYDIATKDAARLAKMAWKQSCENFLESIGTTGAGISFAANIVQFYDGTSGASGAVPLQAMYMFTPQASSVPTTITIQSYLANSITVNPDGSITGIKALAQLNGDQVYLNPSFWGGNSKADLTTVLHELIHNVTGLTDDDIKNRFNSSLDALLKANKCP